MYEIGKMPASIDIGYTGEQEFRTVQIDMSEWVAKVPNGAPILMYIRPGESEPYPVEITYADNIITWSVTDGDLGTVGGTGLLQVWFGVEDEEQVMRKLGMSSVVVTIVHLSISGGANASTVQIPWLKEIMEMKNIILGYDYEAEAWAIGQRGGEDVPATDASYHNNAKYYSDQAEAAKTAAQTAQAACETEVSRQLSEIISNPDSPPLDRTLSSNVSAAPADMVGDLKSALETNEKGYYPFNTVPNTYINIQNGKRSSYNGWSSSDFIPIGESNSEYIKITCDTQMNYCAKYSAADEDHFVESHVLKTGDNFIPKTMCAYLRFSAPTANVLNTVISLANTDKTLTKVYVPADAKETGDKISALESGMDAITESVSDNKTEMLREVKLTNDLLNERIGISRSYSSVQISPVNGSRYVATEDDIGEEIGEPSTSIGYYSYAIVQVTVFPILYKVSLRVNGVSTYHVIYLDANDIIIGGDIAYDDGEYHTITDYELTVPYSASKIIVNSAAGMSIAKADGDYRAESIANGRYLIGSKVDDLIFADSFATALNGVNFTKQLTPRVPASVNFSHGGEMVKTEDGVFVLTSANEVDTGDSPSSVNCYALLAKITGSDLSSATVTRYEIAKYGDTDYDGETIISGVGAGPIRLLNGTIYCFATAKTAESGYCLYYCTFDPDTGTHSALKKCTVNGVPMTVSNLCNIAEVTPVDTFICLNGLIGNNSGTYYGGIAIGNSATPKDGIIVSTTDMINFSVFMIPDFGVQDSALSYEMSVCFFGGKLFCSLRQKDTLTQIVARINPNKSYEDVYIMPDGNGKATFCIDGSKLYILHNILDRYHFEIVEVNTSRLMLSKSVMISNSDNVYPFMYADVGGNYLVSTRNATTKVYLSKASMPTITTEHVYKLLDTFMNYLPVNS